MLESELDEGQRFRLPVRETLAVAERLYRSAMKDAPIAVVREGQVLGDSQTGELDADDSTAYRLEVTSTPLAITPTEEPGGTLDEAYDLGVLGGATIEEFEVVGGFDEIDVYRFTILEAREVTVNLTDRSEGAGLEFVADLDGNGLVATGEKLIDTWNTGSGDITGIEDLAPGYLFSGCRHASEQSPR